MDTGSTKKFLMVAGAVFLGMVAAYAFNAKVANKVLKIG
jgi:hypothetical protein